MLASLADSLPGAIAVDGDLAVTHHLADIVSRVRDAIGPIDTLINAAARGGSGSPAHIETIDEITGCFAVNTTAPLVLSQLVFEDLRANGRGNIVNIGSIAGAVGIGRFPQASYAASKGALHALTRELAAQWSRHGIRVNCLAPGFFRSEMTAPLYDHPTSAEWIRRGELLARPASPEDLVGALLYLVSDSSNTMTGQVMFVDNGWTTR